MKIGMDRKVYYGFVLWIGMLPQIYAQSSLNMTLLANVADYARETYNDCWGFVDKNGVEYAIIGTQRATVIYSLEDPTQPIERAYIPGALSTWRDIKSFDNYLYVVADRGQDGLLIIDMTNAPTTINHRFWKPILNIRTSRNRLQKCHNLYIDEAGYVYLSGCNINEGGIVVLDLNNDPNTPSMIGFGDSRYSHDNFAHHDRVWSADINDGVFSVIDVSDKSNPITLAIQETSSTFTHNCWLSDDGNYLFTTDEKFNSSVDAYDVSDLNNITRLDRFWPLAGKGRSTLPHNTHFHNQFLVTSWYSMGVIITDVSRPDNMIEVGHFDTYPGRDSDPEGCWGAYPYLPSGIVIVSDIQSGLYLLQPEYVKACYLEGSIRDALTGQPIENVQVDILNADLNEASSDIQGQYKTGIVTPGSYEVTFVKPGYLPYTGQATLENGVLTILNVDLQPAATYTISGTIKNSSDHRPIEQANITILNSLYEQTVQTNSNGYYEFETVYESDYELRVGAWGYLHHQNDRITVDESKEMNFSLEVGYQDDFWGDFGWQTYTDSASGGLWERGVPLETNFFGPIANPGMDTPNDIGSACFVTGNDGLSGSSDDVDKGIVRLISPTMDLSQMTNPILSYDYWAFFARIQSEPNDTFRVWLRNPTDSILLDEVYTSESAWRNAQFQLLDYLGLNQPVQVIFESSDVNISDTSQHIVEAAIDGFLVRDQVASSNQDELASRSLVIFPNPSHQAFQWKPSSKNFNPTVLNLKAYNQLGQLIESTTVQPYQPFGAHWPSGVFWLQFTNEDGVQFQEKVIKQRTN